jgi:hypothetical protein
MTEFRTVIAVTGEDDRYEPVRRQAIERALADDATLILYDIDAVTSPLESPLPTGWSAEGTEEKAPDRLGPQELEAAGREAIARQVTDARARGLDAWGWLPSDKGSEALAEYAATQPGAQVIGPEGDSDLDVSELPDAEVVRAGDRSGA